MGSVIESASAVHARIEDGSPSVNDLTLQAASACFADAAATPSSVSLMVHATTFPEGLIFEPASATLIQRRIESELSPAPGAVSPVLCFDLSCGACGPMAALELTDALLESSRFARGLITCGDADPTPHAGEAFPFSTCGGAVLVRRGAEGEGFRGFVSRSAAGPSSLFVANAEVDSTLAEVDDVETGWYRVSIAADPDFFDSSAQLGIALVGELWKQHGRPDIDLILASSFPPEFGSSVAGKLGFAAPVFDGTRLPGLPLHSASIPAAIAEARLAGAWQEARCILFVAVGSGPTVWAALYDNPTQDSDAAR